MGTKNTNAPAADTTTEVVDVKELGPRAKFRLQPVLMLATSNPKKPGSQSHTRFEGYFGVDWEQPQTVGSLLDGRVIRMDDIRNDHDKGYIAVGEEAIAAAKASIAAAAAKALEDAKALVAASEG